MRTSQQHKREAALLTKLMLAKADAEDEAKASVVHYIGGDDGDDGDDGGGAGGAGGAGSGGGAGGGAGAGADALIFKTCKNPDGWSTIFFEHGASVVANMFMAQDREQTDKVALPHGSGGAQVLTERASERERAAEERGVLLHPAESGWPRGSVFYSKAERCWRFDQEYEAHVKGPGERRSTLRSAGWLVRELRSLKAQPWTAIHHGRLHATFKSFGLSISIVKKGAAPPAPFKDVGVKLGKAPAAVELRQEHADLARELQMANPTYRIAFVNIHGEITSKTDLLDRPAGLAALREMGVGDTGTILYNARNEGVAAITVGDVSALVTRVVGTSGNGEDVIPLMSADERQILFISLIPEQQRGDGHPRFGAFLSPDGLAMLARESMNPDKGKPGWKPQGWHAVAGTDLLFTGVKGDKKGVDDITRFFKGKPNCKMHTSITANAVAQQGGSGGCDYFEAHYYACDGSEPKPKQLGGPKLKAKAK
jgi:hypothetical protein